jgi:hypothetical protein
MTPASAMPVNDNDMAAAAASIFLRCILVKTD